MIIYVKIIDSNVTVEYQPDQEDKEPNEDDNESKIRIKMILQSEDFEKQCVEIQNNLNNLV